MNEDFRTVLRQKGFIRQPDGSYSKVAPLAPRPPNAFSERHAGQALVRPASNEERRPERLTVRLTRHASRLLDFDNGAGGCKFLCDALRHEKLIPDDDPGSIDFQFRQVRVKTRADEGTMIEIEP